jgi:hypothetical protein
MVSDTPKDPHNIHLNTSYPQTACKGKLISGIYHLLKKSVEKRVIFSEMGLLGSIREMKETKELKE